jgi:hypothetical protein
MTFYQCSPSLGPRLDRLFLELSNVLIGLKGGNPIKGQSLVEWAKE